MNKKKKKSYKGNNRTVGDNHWPLASQFMGLISQITSLTGEPFKTGFADGLVAWFLNQERIVVVESGKKNLPRKCFWSKLRRNYMLIVVIALSEMQAQRVFMALSGNW